MPADLKPRGSTADATSSKQKLEMWIEGHWFSKDLLSQVILIWLLSVAVAGVVVWRLGRKKKSPAAKNPPAKRTRRHARK